MTALRKEIYSYIDGINENKLKALKPLLKSIFDDDAVEYVIETDLTDEELAIIAKGEEKYANGEYVPFNFD